MSTTTTYMGLTKPSLTDTADITVIDTDMDVIDSHDHSSGKGVQIGASGIANGAIGNAQLAALAVATGNIQNNAVGASQLANGAVGTTQLASAAVTTATIATGAVGTTQLASGAATGAALGSDVATLTGAQTLTNKTLTSPAVNSGTLTTCTFSGNQTGPLTLVAGGNTVLNAQSTTVDIGGNARTCRFDAAGNFIMRSDLNSGAGAGVGGGTNVMSFTDVGVVPSTNPTGGGILYTQAGALKYRGSSGTVTTIANA
ncbi:MAG: hypothetical protein KGL39_05485 [Patescibacteria group bacterium]|nr:hypothetical protein [Patescibacteria group bacterium]